VVKKREEAEAERKLQEARAHGTPVTPESFAAWKAEFEEEQRAAHLAIGGVIEEEVVASKLTGKRQETSFLNRLLHLSRGFFVKWSQGSRHVLQSSPVGNARCKHSVWLIH
jgi:hypothetical protein